MRGPRVFDTNVLIHANLTQSPQTSAACKQRCIDVLFRMMAGDMQMVLDSDEQGSTMLTEYHNNLKYEGIGLGDAFLRWILNNYWNRALFHFVTLTKLDDDTYAEFPNHPDLKGFDPRDRKWVAAAVAHASRYEAAAPIMQSADEKWRDFVVALLSVGVEIDFICDETP